jgi:type II secretory pathway component PulF
MPRFSYIARSATGEKVQGSLEAGDKRAALVQLERMGCVPVSVSEAAGAAAAAPAKPAKPAAKPSSAKAEAKPAAKSPAGRPAAGRKRFQFSLTGHARAPRMNLRELLLFTRELSDLIESGMTLGTALNALSRRKSKSGQDIIIADLRDEIIKGSSLSDALGKWPKVFQNLYISIVRAGEASGALPEALERLCKHYERVQEAREKVMMALTYPSIVLTIGLGTIVFTMVFVVPRFAKIFEDLGGALPLPTKILIGMSGFMVHYGWVLVILIVFIVISLRKYFETPKGHVQWHRFQLRVPLVRDIITANAYSQFARTLGALLTNGVPVLQALSIVENTIGNVVIANEIHEARDRVTDGSTISGPLAQGKVFPELLTDMLAVGEASGDMSGALGHIARRYDGELDRNVKVFTTALEPIMIVFMAGIVGFVAISMLLAVFDLTSGLQVK